MDESTERWLPIPGYEGSYEVSNQGRVRSLDREITRSDGRVQRNRGRVLSPGIDTQGRHGVALKALGHSKSFRVHTLVMLAFVGPRPDGMEVCHWDGRPENNALSNLRYDTRSANRFDAVRHGTHYSTAKRECPREHVLATPNLVAHVAENGHRACLACRRARVNAQRSGQDFSELADLHYRQIMSGTARGKMGARTHCPRDHPLVEPNLVRSAAEDGRRSCLACARAYHIGVRAKRRGEPFDIKAVADQKYAEIMKA